MRPLRGIRTYFFALLLAFGVLCASASLYLSHQHTPQRAGTFFTTALAGARVDERVTIGTAHYRVRDGIVYDSAGNPTHQGEAFDEPILALAYEKALARRSPLFHLAGTKTTDFDTVIDSLEHSQALLARAQTTDESRRRIGGLFPIGFLRTIAQLERARQTFLASGDVGDAYRYRAAFDATIKAYRISIASFTDNFGHSVPVTSGQFASGKIIVGRSTTLATATQLLRQADLADTAAHRRIQCVSGTTTSCDASDIAIPTVPLPRTEYDFAAATVHAKAAERARKAVDFWPTEDFRTIALAESSCIPPDWDVPPFFAFSTKTDDFHSIPYNRPNLVSDIFFLRDRTHSDVPFFRSFADLGVEYLPTSVLTYYKCMELDTDLGNLIATRDTYQFARTAHLSDFASSSKRSLLRDTETALASPIVTQENAVEYLDAASTLVGDAAVPETVRDQIVDLVLEMKDKSAGTYGTALDAAFLSELTLRLRTEGIPTDLSSEYLFSARSGFPALYLAHNPSATGEYRNHFAPNTLSRDRQPYILLTSIAPRFSDDAVLRAQIAHDLRIWKNLHWNPI